MTPNSIVTNEDCMELMKRYPDKYFDLAIVDPPYAHNSGNGFTGRLKNYGSLSYNDLRPNDTYFTELFRVSKHQIIWGGNYFLDFLPPTKCMIFWHKHQPVPSYAKGELAWTSFNERHADIFDYPYFGAHGADQYRTHPNQKPIALYKWLLTNYAKTGDKILDTHLGSGSSRIAAYDMGFDFTACELDKDYFDAQEKRFQDHVTRATEIKTIGYAKTELSKTNPTLFT